MGLLPLEIFVFFQFEDVFYSSESDVCRRQIIKRTHINNSRRAPIVLTDRVDLEWSVGLMLSGSFITLLDRAILAVPKYLTAA